LDKICCVIITMESNSLPKFNIYKNKFSDKFPADLKSIQSVKTCDAALITERRNADPFAWHVPVTSSCICIQGVRNDWDQKPVQCVNEVE